MRISAKVERFALVRAFVISRGARSHAEVVSVQVESGGVTGRGECVPYARYGETVETVLGQIASLPDDVNRDVLQGLLPPGAARNAVDCALWDLAAKREGRRVWEMIGMAAPAPRVTAFTLSLDSPEAMQVQAAENAHRPVLKIKLGTPDDMARLDAVRRGAPRPAIIVDANEGWTAQVYQELAPHLLRLGVAMVEQPLAAGQDEMLREIARPLPVCADESCHDRASLADLVGKYDMVNIKLDKTGGLTEALALKQAAVAQGFQVMVGCMVGTSLAMAPATLLAPGVAFTDLDGPLLLARDRACPLDYDIAGVHPPRAELWG